MTRNIVASWAGHLVFVIAGFILPRLIDRQIGQEALGVWDFGWSLVNYFGLAQVGIGASVTRYVARCRARGDVAGLRCAVSSALCIQLFSASLAILLTAATSWAVPHWWGGQLGDFVDDARWVVFWLGLGIAIQLAFSPLAAVIVGCHRWGLHNTIQSGFYAGTVIVMIIMLTRDVGLPGLALAHFCGTLLSAITRSLAVYHVCPDLRVGIRYVRWSQAVDLLIFGSKSMIGALSRILLYQSNSILVATFLGPATLAVYSRCRALVLHSQTFIGKFASVLTPMASSLQSTGKKEELCDLLVRTARYGAYLAFPMIIFLVVLGNPLLRMWMGERYERGLILAVLALGHMFSMVQLPAITIMTGMNMHGRIGLANLAAAGLSVLLGFFTLGVLRWGLMGAALALVLPLTLANGLYVPIYACRQLGVPIRRYVVRTYLAPALCNVPFAVCLFACRILFEDRPVLALISGSVIGSAALGFLYWHYALPEKVRIRIANLLRRLSRQVAFSHS